MSNAGITTGTSPTTFSPNRPVTRGEVATFLWRSTGSPAQGSSPFADVPAAAFYYDAISWMSALEITNGTGPTTFSPNRPVTRAQAVTFLWRFNYNG